MNLRKISESLQEGIGSIKSKKILKELLLVLALTVVSPDAILAQDNLSSDSMKTEKESEKNTTNITNKMYLYELNKRDWYNETIDMLYPEFFALSTKSKLSAEEKVKLFRMLDEMLSYGLFGANNIFEFKFGSYDKFFDNLTYMLNIISDQDPTVQSKIKYANFYDKNEKLFDAGRNWISPGFEQAWLKYIEIKKNEQEHATDSFAYSNNIHILQNTLEYCQKQNLTTNLADLSHVDIMERDAQIPVKIMEIKRVHEICQENNPKLDPTIISKALSLHMLLNYDVVEHVNPTQIILQKNNKSYENIFEKLVLEPQENSVTIFYSEKEYKKFELDEWLEYVYMTNELRKYKGMLDGKRANISAPELGKYVKDSIAELTIMQCDENTDWRKVDQYTSLTKLNINYDLDSYNNCLLKLSLDHKKLPNISEINITIKSMSNGRYPALLLPQSLLQLYFEGALNITINGGRLESWYKEMRGVIRTNIAQASFPRYALSLKVTEKLAGEEISSILRDGYLEESSMNEEQRYYFKNITLSFGKSGHKINVYDAPQSLITFFLNIMQRNKKIDLYVWNDGNSYKFDIDVAYAYMNLFVHGSRQDFELDNINHTQHPSIAHLRPKRHDDSKQEDIVFDNTLDQFIYDNYRDYAEEPSEDESFIIPQRDAQHQYEEFSEDSFKPTNAENQGNESDGNKEKQRKKEYAETYNLTERKIHFPYESNTLLRNGVFDKADENGVLHKANYIFEPVTYPSNYKREREDNPIDELSTQITMLREQESTNKSNLITFVGSGGDVLLPMQQGHELDRIYVRSGKKDKKGNDEKIVYAILHDKQNNLWKIQRDVKKYGEFLEITYSHTSSFNYVRRMESPSGRNGGFLHLLAPTMTGHPSDTMRNEVFSNAYQAKGEIYLLSLLESTQYYTYKHFSYVLDNALAQKYAESPDIYMSIAQEKKVDCDVIALYLKKEIFDYWKIPARVIVGPTANKQRLGEGHARLEVFIDGEGRVVFNPAVPQR